MKAYVEIAENMPRLDRLQSLFEAQPEFTAVVVDLCQDVLEFHAAAYQILRRGGEY